MNQATLHGRIGRDPEAKILDNGTTVITTSIATERSFQNKQGERQTSTEWHNIVIWGRSGQAFAEHNQKGDQVIVQGELRTRNWEKDGVKHYRTEIHVNNWHFSTRKRDSGAPSTLQSQLNTEDEPLAF